MVTSANSPGRADKRTHTALVIWAGLLGAAALAWLLTVRDAMQMGNMPGTMGLGLAAFLLMWTIMMAAMMLPSVAPVGVLYIRAVRRRAGGVAGIARVVSLVLGYLLAWCVFGILAYVAAHFGGLLAASSPDAAPWVAAGVLAVCGAYQLTPLKDSCLSHCRSPLGLLMHVGNFRGRLRDVRAGVYHGAYCVGCCWGLMLVMVVVGVMNVAWMVALAVVIAIEKSWVYGRKFGHAVGIALIAFACIAPWNPELLSGMVIPGAMP